MARYYLPPTVVEKPVRAPRKAAAPSKDKGKDADKGTDPKVDLEKPDATGSGEPAKPPAKKAASPAK
ncbi:hypothetical protein [Nocardioides speluncae]|uniref:hypothetical protein n=1 Tax=Nocardioides speluncae TaxID=2670337 RepID=UPI000D68BC8D|nr:hypothetical protein [Nocardioides speluncae]